MIHVYESRMTRTYYDYTCMSLHVQALTNRGQSLKVNLPVRVGSLDTGALHLLCTARYTAVTVNTTGRRLSQN